jgi:hypothetical protein
MMPDVSANTTTLAHFHLGAAAADAWMMLNSRTFADRTQAGTDPAFSEREHRRTLSGPTRSKASPG